MSEENTEATEVVEAPEAVEQPKTEERVSNKFKALYEQDKALKVRDEALKGKEAIVNRFDNWSDLTKREKIAILAEDDLYDEYSNVVAEQEESPEEKKEREWKQRVETLEDERNEEKTQRQAEVAAQQELDYKRHLSDFVKTEENAASYGILNELPTEQVEQMLYSHASNYFLEYNEPPNEKELADYVEEQLATEALTWWKIPKIKELLLSQDSGSVEKTSDKLPSTKTMNNSFEASKSTPPSSKENWEQYEARKKRESIEKFGM